MAVFASVRTARKQHRCSKCCETIQPGQRYEQWRMTPDDEMNDGRGWRSGISHHPQDCPITTEAAP